MKGPNLFFHSTSLSLPSHKDKELAHGQHRFLYFFWITMRSFIKKHLIKITFSFVFTYALLEICFWGLTFLKILPLNYPSFSLNTVVNRYLIDIENFGPWHPSNISFRHFTGNFDIIYQTNSYGARDIERNKTSDNRRFLILGDSLIEGHGSELEYRFTNVLESKTKIEHMNFGIQDTGTIHHVRVYEKYSKIFDHTDIILCFFMANDFEDNNFEHGKINHRERYKPYLTGEYPNYSLVYYNKNSLHKKKIKRISKILNNLTKEFSFTLNAFAYLRKSLRLKRHLNHSNDFPGYKLNKKDFFIVKYSLEKLRAIAANKNIYFVLIPSNYDILNYSKSVKQISSKLSEICDSMDVIFIDPIPYINKDPEFVDSLYLKGDGHLTRKGNEVIASILYENFNIY